MSTPTPRTDAVYLEHRYWANEDEATEAIEDLRDLARKLERELATERARLDWLEDNSVCYHVCIDRQPDGYSIHNSPPSPGSVRASIDAAMKEGK